MPTEPSRFEIIAWPDDALRAQERRFVSIVIAAEPQFNEHAPNTPLTWSPTCRPSLGPLCRTSSQAPREPSGAGVDAALTVDELGQGLGMGFAGRRVAHKAAPLAPCSLIRLGRVRCAPNDGGERVLPSNHIQ